MSGQTSQRVRRSSPGPSTKQGPMRATLPVSSLFRQCSSRKSKSNSPTLSPTTSYKTGNSPEVLSGHRSPGSWSYKGKSKTLSSHPSHALGSGCIIRRTASLDTIYLNGQWPKESFYMYCGQLLVDKSTQTEEWPIDQRKQFRFAESIGNEDKLEKYIRHRLQRGSKESASSRERTAAFGLILHAGTHPPVLDHCAVLPSTGTNTISPTTATGMGLPSHSKANPVNIPAKPLVPRPPMRSSIEGLNQEIERLVLKATSGPQDSEKEEEKSYQATPEGHRAPLADLLRSTRSVNTQTPAGGDFTGSSQSSGPPSPDSGSPLIPGAMDISRPSSDLQGSRGSSPDQELGKLGTSPHINKFLAREPPDGCEKVSLKFVEETKMSMADLSKMDYSPLKPCVTFQLKPSLGSAFYPLSRCPTGVINGDLSNEGTVVASNTPLVPHGGETAPLVSNDHNNENAGI